VSLIGVRERRRNAVLRDDLDRGRGITLMRWRNFDLCRLARRMNKLPIIMCRHQLRS
jgi:hypothetical protein